MKHYYFLDTDGHVIRIQANRRPSEKSIPKRGTWVVYEYHPDYKGCWCMAPFPEITWPRLKQMTYIGSTMIESPKDGAEWKVMK